LKGVFNCAFLFDEDNRRTCGSFAAQRGLTTAEVIESGMQENRKEFLEKGAEVYAKT
jgi:hypothetical protein